MAERKDIFIAAVVAFIGVIIIIMALGYLPPDPLLGLGYIFMGIGISLVIYAIMSESVKFYSIWGSITIILGLSIIFRKEINPLIFLGVLLIVLAIISVLVPSHKSSKS